MKNSKRSWSAGVIAAAMLVACGGAQKDASTPSANSPSSMPANADQASHGSPGAPVYPAAPSAMQPGPPAGSSAEPFPSQAKVQMSRVANMDEAFRRIERAGNDCAEACRALTSMDHACGELCAAATGSDERSLCTRSTERVRKARETVKRACGSCPSGTSVEAGDPVPSAH